MKQLYLKTPAVPAAATPAADSGGMLMVLASLKLKAPHGRTPKHPPGKITEVRLSWASFVGVVRHFENNKTFFGHLKAL